MATYANAYYIKTYKVNFKHFKIKFKNVVSHAIKLGET